METEKEKRQLLKEMREKIAFDYCVKMGWPTDPGELSFEQIFEIRELETWKNVPIEIDNSTEKRTAEEIYSNVIGRPGTHKDLPLHINATGEYLRKDLVFTAIHKYAAQELDAYKARLKELLLKRKQEYHKDCLNDAFINGRFWECQELLELIDKL